VLLHVEASVSTLAHHFEEAGGTIYVIVLCYMLVTFLAFERSWAFMRHAGPSTVLTAAIARHLRCGDLSEALAVSAASSGSCARIATRILREGLGAPERAAAAREEALAAEEPLLERRLPYFGSLAKIATLFGLLGTITGLYVGFSCVASCDATSRANMLAKGISESMNNTAAGLFVTTIAIASHLLFRNSADRCIATMRAESKAVVNLLALHRHRIRLHGRRPFIEPTGYRRAA
jgi:biopolymer transport protein ExbB